MADLLKNMPDEAAALHRMAKELLDKNVSEEELLSELQKEGIDRAYAGMIMENVLKDRRNKKDFFKMLIMGIFTIAGALLLNFISYNFAYRQGAPFMLVFWGLVVAGVIMLIQAFGIYRRLPKY